LILLTAVVGVGSFIFHTVATQGAELFDTVPIAVFIYGYLLMALRRFMALSLAVSLALLVAFAAFTYAEAALVPPGALNGSHTYLPALTAMLILGWLVRRPGGPLVLAAGAIFAISLVFRSIDNAMCPLFPLGTHFVWHILNAVVLYLLLHAGLFARAGNPLQRGVQR